MTHFNNFDDLLGFFQMVYQYLTLWFSAAFNDDRNR